jgi:ElaB/YqjD/DUF883 family membrane-anchored ribosome-binding protein
MARKSTDRDEQVPSRAGEDSDPSLARAQAEVAETREQVAHSMTELQQELARAIDWREWVRRKPGLTMGLAVCLGLLLGYSHGRR